MEFTTSTRQTYFLLQASGSEARYYWSTTWDTGKISDPPGYGLITVPNEWPVVLPQEFVDEDRKLDDRVRREIAHIQLPGHDWFLPMMVTGELGGVDFFVVPGCEVKTDPESGVDTILVATGMPTDAAGTHYYLHRKGEHYYWDTGLDKTSVLLQFPAGYKVVKGPSGQPLLVPANKAIDEVTLQSLARQQTLGNIWRLPPSN